MRFILPKDCAGVSHAGTALRPRADGTIEATAGDAPALAAHGIVPAADTPRPPPRRADTRALR